VIPENGERMTYRTPNRATGCAARACAARKSCERGDEFERRTTRTSRQVVFADAMREFDDEVVIRRENPHRLYEFLFFVHFHANNYEEGGGTTAVQP
jgi:hypothetical protein